MGIEYTLANTRNKTMFELGKGIYSTVMDPTPEDAPLFLYRETFIPYFVEYMRECYAPLDEKAIQYQTQLANTLFEFIDGADPEKDLKIANDSDDSNHDLREQGYLYLGSRYTSDTYQQDILRLNRHVKNVDLSQIDFTWSIKRIRQLLIFT